jgi:hypothetical protein
MAILAYFCKVKRIIFLPFIIATVLPFASCKTKKKEEGKPFISVPSVIKEQIKQIDTSLFVIRKILILDSTHMDTSFIKREDFAKEAQDFMDLPDLADRKIARDYKQDSAVYEESLNRVILTYTATDPDVPLRSEQILISPSVLVGDKISTIIATTFKTDRNGSVQKEMLWRIDKSFQVVTTTQLPGQPEKISTVRISWNEDSDQ